MKITPNPEYETAPFEATCIDKDGGPLPEQMVCMLTERPRPPRYNRLPDGTFEEVFAYIIEE